MECFILTPVLHAIRVRYADLANTSEVSLLPRTHDSDYVSDDEILRHLLLDVFMWKHYSPHWRQVTE